MIHFIVTRGFGFAGGVNYIPTMGFTSGEEVATPFVDVSGRFLGALTATGRFRSIELEGRY